MQHADDIALIGSEAVTLQALLYRLTRSAARFGMCTATSKCQVLLQEWTGTPPVLNIRQQPQEVVDRFTYPGTLVTSGGHITEEVTSCTNKARVVLQGPNHL
ncbi:unnamed protein product [Dicrocoelium dendriticum]|nr:unnamed protein product [Dicrocoelium dendriticum]